MNQFNQCHLCPGSFLSSRPPPPPPPPSGFHLFHLLQVQDNSSFANTHSAPAIPYYFGDHLIWIILFALSFPLNKQIIGAECCCPLFLL